MDYITNVSNKDMPAVRDALLHVPNMNTTGRLPGVALVHVNMTVRLTVTLCPLHAPVDTQGVITHIELDYDDHKRWSQDKKAPLCAPFVSDAFGEDRRSRH